MDLAVLVAFAIVFSFLLIAWAVITNLVLDLLVEVRGLRRDLIHRAWFNAQSVSAELDADH